MSRSRSFLRQQSAASPASGAWPVLLMGNERLRADRCICFWLNEPQKRLKIDWKKKLVMHKQGKLNKAMKVG